VIDCDRRNIQAFVKVERRCLTCEHDTKAEAISRYRMPVCGKDASQIDGPANVMGLSHFFTV
jgi:Zn finger protein HypA/HybF involved in hydrogenase expression